METIAKILKAIFFNDEGLDLNVATKVKYIIYGVVITIAVEAVAVFMMPDDEEETEIVSEEDNYNYFD